MTDTQPPVDLTSIPASPAESRAALDSLRQARVDGRVSERDYLTRSDFLARREAGEDVAPPPTPYASPDERLARSFEDAMAPAKPHEYQLPLLADPLTGLIDDNAQAADTAIRDAMAEAGIPRQWGGPIVEIAGDLLTRFKDSDAETIRIHAESIGAKLRSEWGGDYVKRLAGVHEMLATLAETHPIIGELIDNAPHAFASEHLMHWLDHVVRHRGRERP